MSTEAPEKIFIHSLASERCFGGYGLSHDEAFINVEYVRGDIADGLRDAGCVGRDICHKRLRRRNS